MRAFARACWTRGRSSHHGTLVGGLGLMLASILWTNHDELWWLEHREDLEQQLVRNHRQRRIIDQRSNHRHRRHCLLHPKWRMSMEIWTPNELGVGKPLIGSNHMHSMACREGDETSMLVERNLPNQILEATIER